MLTLVLARVLTPRVELRVRARLLFTAAAAGDDDVVFASPVLNEVLTPRMITITVELLVLTVVETVEVTAASPWWRRSRPGLRL